MSSWTKLLALLAGASLFWGVPSPVASRVAFAASTASVPPAFVQQENPQSNSDRVQVAQGEYQTLESSDDGGIGAYAPDVYNFHESWTLWKLPDGTFEVEGVRKYESPQGFDHSNAFSVHLAPDFRALGVKEFRKLRWRQDSGPLACEFLPLKLDCTSGAKNSADAIDLNMPMRDAYGFLWPISAFSLSNITRHAVRIPGKLTPVQLVTVEEPNAQNPVYVSTLDGHLKYIGQEEITQAGKRWRADKFELKVPLHLPFIIWTSPQGLLLAFAPESAADSPQPTGLRLVHFEQSANF